MRVYLTGFMGAGKSTVGRRLAGLLGCPFIDLDAEVERLAGDSVAGIFARHGEARFRRLESEALRAVRGPAVIATGGGTMASPANRDEMRRGGVSVWLDPGLEHLLERLAGEGGRRRPLFRDAAQAEELYRSRIDGYRSSDLRVEIAGGETPEEIARRIGRLLRESPCVT